MDLDYHEMHPVWTHGDLRPGQGWDREVLLDG